MNKQDGTQEPSCARCKGTVTGQNRGEVEYLKQRLIDRDYTIVQLEAKMAHERPHIYSQGQLATLRAVCDNWQDKYERLLDAHKRIQRVNQGLEDKLLRLVDRMESEKARMAQDTANLTTALTTAAQAINRLKNENKLYQSDLSLAIQLLQCNPSQYASHKLDMLPAELQEKVRSRMNIEQTKPIKSEAKIIRVPISTFPPTAMVYSINKSNEKEAEEEEPVDMVSAAIMLAVLEEREKERSQKHCQTCTCKVNQKGTHSSHFDSFDHDSNSQSLSDSDNGNFQKQKGNKHGAGFNFIDVGTQTVPSYIGETGKVTSTCIYCQSNKIINGNERSPNSSYSGSESGVIVEHSKCRHNLSSKGTAQDFKEHASIKEASNKKNGSTRMSCSWDWHTDSQDSGSPSTPTSLISASLSYESETSCFTSPHDSPGHFSFHMGAVAPLPKSQDDASTRLADVPNVPRPKRNSVERCQYSSEGSSVTSKIPSTIQPDLDFFTTPIHCSPPSRAKNKAALSCVGAGSESLPVIYSTTTWSATETTL